MKFTCSKEDLLKGIGTVIRTAYGKYQKSILECIHIVTENGLIYLDTFDMYTAIKTSVYAEIDTPGETAIPARILNDMIQKFPAGEITFEREGNSIRISGANSDAVLSEMDASQFPAFPTIEGEKLSIHRPLFKRLIEKTAFSAYVGEDRPIFTGLLLETDPAAEEISLVGIDGVRLAKNNASIASEVALRAVIPSRMLKEASRIVGTEDKNVDLYISQNTCFIVSDDTTIFTRLLDGEYMNYHAIIPANYKTRVKIEVEAISRSLELMMVLAREDGSNLIRMAIQNDYIEFSSVSEYGAAKDSVPVETEGELLKIAFNAKYLLDIFKVIDDEVVYMEFTGRLQACVVRPLEENEYLYLVVPVNVAE